MPILEREGKIVTSAAVAVRDGRCFLARRKPGGDLGGMWEFPGGKCDQDNSGPGCLVRELREELGVTVTVHEELGSTPFIHRDTEYMLVAWRVTIPDGEEPRLYEHVDSGWFRAREVATLNLAPSDRALLATAGMRRLLQALPQD